MEPLYTNKTFVLEEIAFCLHFEDCQKYCVLAVYLLPSVTENNVLYLFTSVQQTIPNHSGPKQRCFWTSSFLWVKNSGWPWLCALVWGQWDCPAWRIHFQAGFFIHIQWAWFPWPFPFLYTAFDPPRLLYVASASCPLVTSEHFIIQVATLLTWVSQETGTGSSLFLETWT